MFLLQLILALVAASLLGAALLFVWTIIKTVAARRDFERRACGLPIADHFSIWAGHVNSYLFSRGQMYAIDSLKKQHRAKTVGWMYGSSKAAATVDLELMKEMIFDQQENNRMALNLPVEEVETDCLMLVRDEQWHRIRRVYAPALRANKFKTPIVQREIDSSIDKLIAAIESKLDRAQQDEIELNVNDYAHRYQLDLVLSCFYKQDSLIDFESAVEPLAEMTESGFEAFMWNPLVRLCVVFPVLRPLIDWLSMHFHPQGAWRRRMMEFIRRQTRINFKARRLLAESRKSGNKRIEDEDRFVLDDGTEFNRNMIDHVIDQFYDGKLTRREFFHSTFFLFNAAEKTSSDALVHTLYQLAVHGDIQEKLRQSVRDGGENSEYLSWVFNESLRLLPPVAIGCSRMTSRDYKCEDGVVPAGTFVVTAAYSIHRLEKYWGPDAEEFRPERFADTSNFHPLQFIPFGAGARQCPGKEFALHEMKRLLCALLTRFKFRCDPIHDLSYDSPFFFLQLPNKQVHVTLSKI